MQFACLSFIPFILALCSAPLRRKETVEILRIRRLRWRIQALARLRCGYYLPIMKHIYRATNNQSENIKMQSALSTFFR